MTENCTELFKEASFDISSGDQLEDNVISIPMTGTEVLVFNDESTKRVNTENVTYIHPSNVLSMGNHYIVAHLKENSGSTETFLTLDNGRKDIIQTLEPPKKKLKTEIETEESLKKMVVSIQQAILQRLESIEKKLDKVTIRCQCLEEKVENLLVKTTEEEEFKNKFSLSAKKGRSAQIIVGVPPQASGFHSNPFLNEEGSSLRLIPLNSEETYPDGSWLGDAKNPDMRVRCGLSSSDLAVLNETCTTPEKMGLTLLDYLFDRETQACSNMSGTGKHGKLQLDPLKVYGIRCHLMHIFGISVKHWHRIKQNLDSKCRTAFRRKQRGMPLAVKGFRERTRREFPEFTIKSEHCSESSIANMEFNKNLLAPASEPESLGNSHDSEMNEDSQNVEMKIASVHSLPLAQVIAESQIIHTEHGDIQVIQATAEQLAELKNNHQIEILTEAGVLTELKNEV